MFTGGPSGQPDSEHIRNLMAGSEQQAARAWLRRAGMGMVSQEAVETVREQTLP